MRTRDPAVHKRIVEAAYYLFYRRGYARVSMEDIAARAGVTKRTLYARFRSKDDLLAETLTHYSELDKDRLRVIAARLPEQPSSVIDSFFVQLGAWAGKPRWTGSGFTRLVIELADLPGHPARAIARRAKAATELWLAELLARERVRAPRMRAREAMLLMEGAMALALIHNDRSYIQAASRAAKRLITPVSAR